MHLALFGACVALILYFSPRATDETVVLLPGPDGKVGVVVVERDGERTVLDQAYEASRTGSAGAQKLEEASVRREFGTLLAALPPRPASYVLYFVTGQDELTDESKADLRRLLEELRTRPDSDIQLVGHTDRVGKDASNDALSLQRAERVKKELLGLGIEPRRVSSAGRGEREPLVRTADGAEEPRNRRVEVIVR
jgi:outer membrane protein OmpA-like peptidoglycan-associated protein